MSSPRRRAYLALSLNALIWGAAFPIIKPALSYLTATEYLYFRFLVAGIFAIPIFLVYYFKKHPSISYIIKILLLEVAGTALPLLLLYEGLSKTTALEASLIGATGPIFVVLGGILFLHERESKREWQGLALSLLGSLILVAEPLLLGQTTDTPQSTLGNLLVLGYNALYMVYALIAKRTYKSKPPLYFGSPTYLLTAGIYALYLATTHSVPSLTILLAEPSVLWAVLYMAIPGSILAFALYLYAQSKIEVSEANLFTYLNGVVAIPVSFLLLGETPSWLTLIAIAVVAYGVIRAQIKSSH